MKTINSKSIITFYSCAVLLLLSSVILTSAQYNDDDWVRVRRGEIPKDAVKGGIEDDGNETYVCRASYNGSYIGGKAINGRCYYNAGRGERDTSRFEVLIGSQYFWRKTSNYARAVVVGSSNDENYYVCRVFPNRNAKTSYIGRTENGRCYYTRNNRGYSSRRFEILVGDRRSNTLLDVASRGDYLGVRSALRNGQAINQTDSYGKTALMLAAEKGYERVVQELLYERATIDLRDKKGNTALIFAASKGHSNIVRTLLREGANSNAQNDNGDTAFTLAASEGRERIVQEFLRDNEYGGVSRLDTEKGFRNAAYYGHTDVLNVLLNYGVSVESKDELNGKTALMQAAAGGQKNVVRYLLRNDASINSVDDVGWTPFLHAVNANSEGVMKIFVEEKGFIKSTDSEAEKALQLSARVDKRKALRYLLKKGVDVNSKSENNSWTALMFAANEGNDDVCKILLKANANMNLQNERGETALMLAAANSKNNTTKMLVKAGADLNIRDNGGMTALDWAIQNKHKDTRKTLQKAGAKQ